jgi:integrase
MTLHRAMREMAEDYICLRRSLGFKFTGTNQGWLVRDFARNLDDQHVTHVTTQAAAAWATLPSTSLAWHSYRLGVARGFAGYLHTLDPVHQVPPADLIPCHYHRPEPYLFSAAGISALIQAAGTLRPALRAATLQTVIALLATTGIRPGEATALNCEHVDLRNAVLTVANTKFGKSREILLHSTAVAALTDYRHLRDRLCPHPAGPGFFVPRPGGRQLNRRQLDYAFAHLAAQAGLRPRSTRCHPVPMGLRHTFAVTTLISWYQAGADIGAHLPLLSTWMGHVRPADTYWYISAVPELLALAAERMTRAHHHPEESR